MKKLALVLALMCSFSLAAIAQTPEPKKAETASTTTEAKKRPPIFRANKERLISINK